MPRLLTLLLTLCLTLGMLDMADAKRLGGGRSYGSAPSHSSTPMRRAEPQPSSSPSPASAPAAPGPSRWIGPLAGFAAGGLLASMFAGHDYAGPQWLDLLILGGLAFLAYRLFKGRRRSDSPATATPYSASAYNTPTPISAASTGLPSSPVQPQVAAPVWFDQERFIAEGRRYFMEFQQYWDANEMERLAEYFTPQMMEFLREERARSGTGYQSTYIDNLQVYLDGVDDLPDVTVATLTFIGVAKTSRFDAGEAFSESWRMERSKTGDQHWRVAGIRQNPN